MDRPERRAAGVGLDDYLAPVNSLLSWPALPPSRVLADRLGSYQDEARFWSRVRGEGGILVRVGSDDNRRLVYLRAMRRGGDQVFAVSDPERSGDQVVPLPEITTWAGLLSRGSTAGSCPGTPVQSARRLS